MQECQWEKMLLFVFPDIILVWEQHDGLQQLLAVTIRLITSLLEVKAIYTSLH